MALKKNSDLLVWIDLEMTGLTIAIDTILEISIIVTNNALDIIHYGPSLVIQTPLEQLQAMNSWCSHQHGSSGLTHAALTSSISLEHAQHISIVFLKEVLGSSKGVLCGNSVWQDRVFLSKYMPELVDLLCYKMIDVSSISELVLRWYPEHNAKEFKKSDTHRAFDDILQSVAQLKHYRQHFFIL